LWDWFDYVWSPLVMPPPPPLSPSDVASRYHFVPLTSNIPAWIPVTLTEYVLLTGSQPEFKQYSALFP
jgi:hypothetical protein